MHKSDLIGRVFGGLTVIGRADPTTLPCGARRTRWLCQCECAREIVVHGANLLSGGAVSCGCQSRGHFTGSKKCRSCLETKRADQFQRTGTGRLRQRCESCADEKDEINIQRQKRSSPARTAAHRQKLREQAIAKLGGICKCCGENRMVFLAVDHIHGGGSAEERQIGTYGIYRRVLSDSDSADRYQVLCNNCNWAKHQTGGCCPHNEPSWMPSPIGGGFFCAASP